MRLEPSPARRARPKVAIGFGHRYAVALACVVSALAPRPAAATQAQVIVPETPIRSAPFDVAPELARAHANDRFLLQGAGGGEWRQVRLPNGRFGYLRAASVTLIEDPPPVAQAVPVAAAPPTLAGAPVEDAAVSAAGAPAPAPAPEVATPAPPAALPATTTTPAPEPRPGPTLLGIMFEILPVGTLAGKASDANQNRNASTDTVFAVAVAPFVDVPISRHLSLGGSPQVVFRVKGDGVVGQSATEFDLRARLTGRAPLSPRVAVFGRLSLAYSTVVPPEPPPDAAQTANPAGLLIDVSVGSEVALLPDLFLLVDLGYQLGFQSATAADGSSFDGTRYLHLGVGLAVGL